MERIRRLYTQIAKLTDSSNPGLLTWNKYLTAWAFGYHYTRCDYAKGSIHMGLEPDEIDEELLKHPQLWLNAFPLEPSSLTLWWSKVAYQFCQTCRIPKNELWSEIITRRCWKMPVLVHFPKGTMSVFFVPFSEPHIFLKRDNVLFGRISHIFEKGQCPFCQDFPYFWKGTMSFLSGFPIFLKRYNVLFVRISHIFEKVQCPLKKTDILRERTFSNSVTRTVGAGDVQAFGEIVISPNPAGGAHRNH